MAITVGVVALLLGAMAILLPLLRARNFARHFDSMQAIERDLYRIYTEEGDPLGPLTAREINRFLVNLYAEWGGADRLVGGCETVDDFACPLERLQEMAVEKGGG